MTPLVGWSPAGRSSLSEEEATKKVPDYLVALAMSLEDDTDAQTMPMCGIATNTLEAFEQLGSTELSGAFDSLDQLESIAQAAGPAMQVYQSGIVPAHTSPREVIPPPRRIGPPPPPKFAFEASLDAFTPADVPFQAEADNQPDSAKPATPTSASPAPSAAQRAHISRCIASGFLALVTLLVLIVIGGRPLVLLQPVARTPIMLRVHAERSDSSGIARSPGGKPSPAQRATPVVVAKTPHLHARPAPTRVAKTPGAPGHIIRTSPF